MRILGLVLKYRYLMPSEIVLLLCPQAQRGRPETLAQWESRVEKTDESGQGAGLASGCAGGRGAGGGQARRLFPAAPARRQAELFS